MEASALGVARLYRDFAGGLLLDQQDRELQPLIEALDMKVAVAQTVMRSDEDKQALAQSVLAFFGGR